MVILFMDLQLVTVSTAYLSIAISNLRPQVTIMYVNNSGLEGYWTYHSQDVVRAGTSYVNDYTRNLVFIEQFTYNPNALAVSDINLLYAKTMGDDTGALVGSSYTYEKDRIKNITHNGYCICLLIYSQ